MDNTDKKVGIGIAVVIAVLVGLYFLLSQGLKQEPSDCSSSQKYNYSTERCEKKTEADIEQEKKEAAEARKQKLTSEIRAKKQRGEICLSAEDAWLYAGSGKTYCVVFHPGYFYHTGYGLMFINQYEDYRKGFVAPLVKKWLISWDGLLANYKKDLIAVTGELVWYEGHPEIKVYDLSQITIPKLYNCDSYEGCVYTKN